MASHPRSAQVAAALGCPLWPCRPPTHEPGPVQAPQGAGPQHLCLQEPSLDDNRYLFSPSRLGELNSIYSNFHFIGVFVESTGIIHGQFRFSSGNDCIFVHKVQIMCQLNSPSIGGCPLRIKQWRFGMLWKPSLAAGGRSLNRSQFLQSLGTGDRDGIQGM